RIPAHGAVLAIIVHGHPARNGHAVTEFEGAVQRGAGPYSISEVPRVYDMDVRQRSARAVFGLPFAVGPFGGMKATFLVRAMAPVPARYPVDSNWSLPKFDVQEISTSTGCWSAPSSCPALPYHRSTNRCHRFSACDEHLVQGIDADGRMGSRQASGLSAP